MAVRVTGCALSIALSVILTIAINLLMHACDVNVR